MDLEDVDGHAASGGELLVTDMALEVLRFLMLNQDLLVVEFAIAVITPHFGRNSLLLLPHRDYDPSRIGFKRKFGGRGLCRAPTLQWLRKRWS